MLAKKDVINEGALTRIFRGLLFYNIHQKGKITSWVVAMTYLSTDKKDLPNFVEVIQTLIFYIAHCFIFVLTTYICVYACQEKLWWLH